MTNIPFPNPHDADALNDYLDDLAAGKQVNPESDVEMAAQDFHQLASRAEVNPPTQQPIEQMRGKETMHTATLAAPVSNRTRQQMAAVEKKSGRSFGWLSAVIVAGLMISMMGSAWLNREPGNPHDQLAFAPGTPEAILDNALTPESAPWIADFDPADCTERSDLEQVQITHVSVDPQGYGVMGPADTTAATDAAAQYRTMRACPTYAGAWAYWSEARINEHPRVINDVASQEISEMQDHFAGVYPDQFMAVGSDLPVTELIETEWSARIAADMLGLPIPLDAKLNPEWAVELSDGRIAFPATIMYSANDPAIEAHGLPIDTPASTVVMIFSLEDGAWKYDDSLQLCLVNCKSSIADPLSRSEAPTAADALGAVCSLEEMTAGEYRQRTSSVPTFPDRSYEPDGTPESTVAEEVVETFAEFEICSLTMDEYTVYPLFTDLGLHRWIGLSAPESVTQPELAQVLREGDQGTANIVASASQWHQVDVTNWPVHRIAPGGLTPERWWDAETANHPHTWPTNNYVDPERAVLLEDGRVAITTTTLISSEDRGAILYEGDTAMFPMPVVIYENHDGTWLIDEVVQIPRHVGQITPSPSWWWDERFDPEPTPWTAPITYDECPQDEVLPLYDRDNPSGVQYTQEEYDQVSIERSYEVVGPADPDDALTITIRMRQAQGCTERSQALPIFTARNEYESRTTAGRNSLESLGPQRTEGADAIAAWYENELGLTPEGMWVYQDPEELTGDTPVPLQTRHMINPDHAVLLADGRIVTIGSVVTYEPITHDILPHWAVYVTIWANVDGEWLVDERLPICFGDCSGLESVNGVGGDVPGSAPIATPAD